MRYAFHCHLPLLHRLEKRRLGFRRGAVDLVGQYHLGDDRPCPKLEVAVLLVVYRHAGYVGRQQVRRELYAFEFASGGPGDASGQHGLAHPWHILDQRMPLAYEGYHAELDGVVLADYDALDVFGHLVGDFTGLI